MRVPFDQLQVFHKEEFQQYVDQTLIVSTVVYEYISGQERSSNLILTKRQLYILQGSDPVLAAPTKVIIRLIKCKHHPELVIQFAEKEKSIRIATTTADRCQLIVQGLAYVSNMFFQRPLLCFTMDLGSLACLVQDTPGNKANTELVVHKMLSECTDVQTLYYTQDKAGPEQENQPQKVLYVKTDRKKLRLKSIKFKEKLKEEEGYSLFMCKLQDQMAVCRVYEKNLYRLEGIGKHTELPGTECLLLVIETAHKYFMLFEHLEIVSRITSKYLKQLVLALMNDDIPAIRIRRTNIILASKGLVWKQSRYFNQNSIGMNWEQFASLPPQLLQRHLTPVTYGDNFQGKIYVIGVLLYSIIYKVLPFHIYDLEAAVHVKQTEGVQFPRYLKCPVPQNLKDFLSKCTFPDPLSRFRSESEIRTDPWWINTSY